MQRRYFCAGFSTIDDDRTIAQPKNSGYEKGSKRTLEHPIDRHLPCACVPVLLPAVVLLRLTIFLCPVQGSPFTCTLFA